MTDCLAALLLSDPHLGASDDRPCKGGAEEVAVLEYSVALHGAEAQLFDKLPSQVLYDHLLGADLEGLCLGGLEILLLADIGAEGDD